MTVDRLLRRKAVTLAVLGVVLGAVDSLSQQAASGIRVERNVMVPMRDGVRLATNLFLPGDSGRHPVVLLRTPYGKSELEDFGQSLAQRGYAAVWQDGRGRFASEGQWVPFFNEAKDGYDTIQWAASQPWSDGRVVTFGGSYDAMVQWLAAKELNPHLKGMVSVVSPGDFYQDFIYEGGAFLLGAGAMWATLVDGKGLNDPGPLPWDRVLARLPVADALGALQRDPAYYRDWLAHPTYDGYWRALRWEEAFPSFDFPVLHLGGWFDIFQKGTIENFRRMTSLAKPGARSRQQLVMGPWGHQGQERSKAGEVDFGAQSAIQLLQMVTSWLDREVKGKADGPAPAPVRVFTMGENRWNDYDAWPVPGTRYVDYFLRSGGKGNSAAGDGLLSIDRPGPGETADTYQYDPRNPVPTRGGGNCCWPAIIPWGPLDQRSVEARTDVLVYTTPPLESDLRVTGAVELRLWIASTALSTDFTGKLVDVAPDGFAMNLTDGIQRVTHREGDEREVALRPNTPTEITVDLWNTSHVFLRGHRIRLEVSSSNFPRYSRNLNTGQSPETSSEVATARQTVFHNEGRPSRLVLPVLKR